MAATGGLDKAVYLSAITVAAGLATPITELPELSDSTRADLLGGGMRMVRVSEGPRWRMAADCVGPTLAHAATRVHTVLYGSDRGPERDRDPVTDVAEFLVAAGLNDSIAIGANLNLCANLGSLVMMGHALVAGGRTGCCLLVAVDRASHDDRMMEGGGGILSDAAATCLLSADPAVLPAFRVLGIEVATSAELGLALMSDNPGAAADLLESIEAALERLWEATRLDQSQVSHVVLNHYVDDSIKVIQEILEIPLEKAYRSPVAQYAHCHAADGLIGLDHLGKSGLMFDGEYVLLLCTSPNTWFLVALQYVAD